MICWILSKCKSGDMSMNVVEGKLWNYSGSYS